MKINLDFTFKKGAGQEPEDFRYGITEVTDQLFLGGEEDVCQVLSDVQVWVDLRNEAWSSRIVEIPEHVTYIRIPIADGDTLRAENVLSKAKQIIDLSLTAGEKVVVSCHAGVSRSAVIAWWILAEKLQDAERAWALLKSRRHHIEPDEGFFPFIEKVIVPIKPN